MEKRPFSATINSWYSLFLDVWVWFIHLCTVRTFCAEARFLCWDIAQNMQGDCFGRGGPSTGLANTRSPWPTLQTQGPLGQHCLRITALSPTEPGLGSSFNPALSRQQTRGDVQGEDNMPLQEEYCYHIQQLSGDGGESIHMQTMERQ